MCRHILRSCEAIIPIFPSRCYIQPSPTIHQTFLMIPCASIKKAACLPVTKPCPVLPSHFSTRRSMDSRVPQITVQDTYGAGYIGVILTAILYGLTTLQTYFYYVHYTDDGLDIKFLVSLIWVLDSLHMATVAYCIYYYLAINYNNPLALGVGHWSLFMSVGFNVIIAFVVQCFFTRKIHILCRPSWRWFVTSIISLSVVAHLGFGIETVIYLFIKKELSRLPEITVRGGLIGTADSSHSICHRCCDFRYLYCRCPVLAPARK